MAKWVPPTIAVALGVAVAQASLAAAAPPPGRLTPATIFDWRTVANPQVSPSNCRTKAGAWSNRG